MPRSVSQARPVRHLLGFQALGLVDVPFGDLEGFEHDDHAEAFSTFCRSCAAIISKQPCLRKAAPGPAGLDALCRLALRQGNLASRDARLFFETYFEPCRVVENRTIGPAPGFFPGYYEPVVPGSLTRSDEFVAPVLAPLLPRRAGESAAPYPDRATIEALADQGRAKPVAWLRDKVEVFFVQIQGSARVRLSCGRNKRLVYAGRNGWPYASIGKILIEEGAIGSADMSLAAIKRWIREHGQEPGEPGLALMHKNQSYVFFNLIDERDPSEGPIGGEGIPLTSLRSIALDRTFYTYGLPVWISADLPWQGSETRPFRRLMIAQDTGAAIVGPARADIFFGSGNMAGAIAGNIRHKGDFVVLVPRAESIGQ